MQDFQISIRAELLVELAMVMHLCLHVCLIKQVVESIELVVPFAFFSACHTCFF